MGVPRLTTDLQPYLEYAIICKDRTPSSTAVQVSKIVIDGPGMIYHVYNKLAAHKINNTGDTAQNESYNPPTYQELCVAVNCFLNDLEESGAEIVHIYFDGGLPEAKQATRLNRLEKTLQQLGAFRLVYPNLVLGLVNQAETTESKSNYLTLSRLALWSTGTAPFNANSGLPQLPFIVAVAREHLSTSKWSSCTSTVPGEADSYCAATAAAAAAAAHSSQTAVLTNDSDLVLFEDMQTDGVVMLLNSLVKSSDDQFDLSRIRIHGSCWRSKEIKRKLALANLLWLGFERMQDPSCSFLTLIQRAKASSQTHAVSSEEKYSDFARQFQSESEGSRCKTGSAAAQIDRLRLLDMLDPRLAEVVVQLEQTHDEQAQVEVQGDVAFKMYFPVLHEDPNRDASWSYGRRYRQLGYSSLYHCHHHHLSIHLSRHCNLSSDNIVVTEFIRKGHIINQENTRVLSHHNLLEILKQCHNDLEALSPLPSIDGSSGSETVSKYILHALTHVLQHRSSNGKKPLPPRLLAQFLGLSPFPRRYHTITFSTSTSNSNSDVWTLLHLNANVQAVLYSLRILKQSIDYCYRYLLSSSHVNESEIESRSEGTQEIVRRLPETHGILANMPTLQTLFLSPTELAAYFQMLSGDEISDLLKQFDRNTGVDLTGSKLPTTDKNTDDGGLAAIQSGDNDAQFQEQTGKKRKKQGKKGKSEPKIGIGSRKIAPRTAVRNMFDVLGGGEEV